MKNLKLLSSSIFTVVTVFFLSISEIQAQTGFSADLRYGSPIVMASIPNKTSYAMGFALRFNFTPSWSMQATIDQGQMRGEQNVQNGSNSNFPVNFKSFNSEFTMVAMNLHFNLRQMKSTRSILGRINPFLIAGAGWVKNEAVAYRWDGRTPRFDFNYYVSQVGFELRHYITPGFDIHAGGMMNFTQTAFLDAIASDRTFDKFLHVYAGITYKIGSGRFSSHADWGNLSTWGGRSRRHRW